MLMVFSDLIRLHHGILVIIPVSSAGVVSH